MIVLLLMNFHMFVLQTGQWRRLYLLNIFNKYVQKENPLIPFVSFPIFFNRYDIEANIKKNSHIVYWLLGEIYMSTYMQ